MPDGKFRTMLLETVRPGFMFDGYSFKIAQTTIAGTRTPNLQAQRTATINSKQLTDHVLSSIIRGRDVCRLLLLAGVALKDDEMITEFLARCSSSPTGVELLVNKGVRGYLAEYIMGRWKSQYRGCRAEVTNHFEDVTVSRVLLAIGGVSAEEVMAQQSKSSKWSACGATTTPRNWKPCCA